MLVERWKKAHRMNTVAHQTFLSLTESLPPGKHKCVGIESSALIYIASDETIEQWIKEEKSAMSGDKIQRTRMFVVNLHGVITYLWVL